MSFAEYIGWLLIGAAIAAVIVQRRPGRGEVAEAEVGGASRPVADIAVARETATSDEAWCQSLAALCGGSIFLFDEGLRLVASGGVSAETRLARRAALHLIDFGTTAETAVLLGHASAARRGERASWRMPWESGEAAVTAVGLDARQLLLHIQPVGR